MQGDFQFQNFGTHNGISGSTGPGGGIGSSGAGGQALAAGQLAGINSSTLSSPGGGYVAVEFVFIQFAGFTFGKSASAFATPWHGYPGNNTSYLIGGHDTVTGVNNGQYSWQFGNGVSGTIGLDDPTVFHRHAPYNPSLGLASDGFTTTGSCGFAV